MRQFVEKVLHSETILFQRVTSSHPDNAARMNRGAVIPISELKVEIRRFIIKII